MQFSAENAQKILKGRKVQTRRLVSPDEVLMTGAGGAHVYKGAIDPRRLKWATGKVYSVQEGRGMHATGYIKLKAIRQETLGAITYYDARAEGYESIPEFFTAWQAIHGKKASFKVKVWVLTFELVTEARG